MNHKVLDDLSRVFGGAFSSVGALKIEMERFVHTQIQQFMHKVNFVTREEFEAVKDTLAQARDEQDELRDSLKKMEKELSILKKK